MAVIVDLTLALYVYIMAAVICLGPLILSSQKYRRDQYHKRQVERENLLKLRNWRTR